VPKEDAEIVYGIRDAVAFREVSKPEQIGEGAGIAQVVLLCALGDETDFVHVRRMHFDPSFLNERCHQPQAAGRLSMAA